MVSVNGTNGQDKSRLDRIEENLERHSTIMVTIDKNFERHSALMVNINASIERQERANEAAHQRFEEEDKRLLTAQILMNGAMQKMAYAMEKAHSASEETWKAIERLELKMEETTGKLNALIETVDGIIRRPPDPNPPATTH
jgi:chromosome segregation ATPase